MPNAIDILERLISFPSVSARSNLDLIQWIRDRLAEHGVKSDLVPAPDGQPKANLWASIGPDAPGGLVLSGHTDVVPVEGQPWSSDPFTLIAARRPALWPRHLRHEELHCLVPRAGAGDAGAPAEGADPLRLLL